MGEDILLRNNVNVSGSGEKAIIFAPGFGCDQTVWNSVAKAFDSDFQTILFDYVGSGQSDLQAYDYDKYSKLAGYAEDILDVCAALHIEDAVLVGHSVGSMIGMLASISQPEYFSQLIMLGPSPCYLNDPPEYFGGFEKEELQRLLDLMEKNYIGWANTLAATIMNNPNRPDLVNELEDRFCSTDPTIAHNFAKATFFSDSRKDLSKVTVPTLILQCSDDIIAPDQVGKYVHEHLPGSTFKKMQAIGHCPHMSHPEETIALIRQYLNEKGLVPAMQHDRGDHI